MAILNDMAKTEIQAAYTKVRGALMAKYGKLAFLRDVNFSVDEKGTIEGMTIQVSYQSPADVDGDTATMSKTVELWAAPPVKE